MRAPRGALLAVVSLCLTACTTVLAGSGSAPGGSNSNPGSGSGSGSHSAAPKGGSSVQLRRVPQHGPLGDPVTADFCHGISMSAFARFGIARVHGWQTATTCYIDIYRYDDTFFQLNTWYDGTDFVPGNRPARTLRSGVEEYSFPARHGDCERALSLHDIVFETHTYNLHGTVPSSVLCAAAETLARQQMKAYGGHAPPKRSLATPSLTSYDLCDLMIFGHYEKIPGLADATTSSFLEDAGCDVYNARLAVSARVAFVNLDFELAGRVVDAGGYRLSVYSLGARACEVISVQHATQDGRAHEILDVGVSRRSGAPRHLCTLAERVTRLMLHTAKLH